MSLQAAMIGHGNVAHMAIVYRTYLSDNIGVKGSEFLRKIYKAARANGWSVEWRPNLGKGSHGLLIVNGKRTILRNLADELKTGTLHGMLKQLGIKESDL